MKTRRFIISAIALICTMGGAWASSIPGTLPGLFTINVSGEKVVFSQGNLQYQASTNTWRFAEHQYDYIGKAQALLEAIIMPMARTLRISMMLKMTAPCVVRPIGDITL